MKNILLGNRLLLYVRTASHLKPKQIAFMIRRRLFPAERFRLNSGPVVLRKDVRMLCEPIPARPSGTNAEFQFLNVAKAFKGNEVDWKSTEMPKLWRYNLQYFDYLLDEQRSLERKCQLITHWIANNPPGNADAWEPYTVSLRIVNWIKFFLLLNGANCGEDSEKPPRQEWTKSLYQQAMWLERNIEYHFLANHYLKNGVALLFAGMYFEGSDADRWFQTGLEILRDELKEQFLDDGGHFERSPMYHSISVVDYLDVLNLTQHSTSAILCGVRGEFVGKVTTALNFLNGICLPDGDIPLFNDSALGIAPTPPQIFEYAERVIGYQLPHRSVSLTTKAFPSSGYYVCRNANDMIVIDGGLIGPDYNPAHAHCDTLSYELAIDGRRMIVDSGVFDYEPSQERTYARSTRGHNTVMVDGEEQSEIWGVFRVARRADPIGATIAKLTGDQVRFEGAHDGFRRLRGQIIHKRVIEYDGFGTWTVLDRATGMGNHHVESYVHLHPEYSARQGKGCIEILKKDGNAIGRLEVIGNVSIRFEPGKYFPEFGIEHKNEVVVLSCSGTLPMEFGYRIIKEP